MWTVGDLLWETALWEAVAGGATSHSCHRPRGFHLPTEGDRPARRTHGHVLAPPLTGRCVPGGSPASAEFCVGCAGPWIADGETWCVATKTVVATCCL